MPMTSEANGYGHKGRQPVGRSIVEERSNNCKLTVWAQDLRPETRYGIFMLFPDAGRYAGIGMGTLTVDEKGKGEMRREFEPGELDEFKLSDIVAVAVIVRGTSGVISPLCGYRSEPVTWRHTFYEHRREIVTVTRDEAPFNTSPLVNEAAGSLSQMLPAAEAPVGLPQPPPIEAAESLPQIPSATEAIEIPPQPLPIEAAESLPQIPPAAEAIEIPPQPLPIEATAPPPPAAPSAQPEENDPPYDPTPIRQFTNQTTQPKSEIAKSFRIALDQLHADTVQRSGQHPAHPLHKTLETIFSSKEHITPFQKQARKTLWVRFDLSDQVPPPINKPHLFKEPFILSALAQHGHLILGMTAGTGPKRYIIGVPNHPDQESRQKARRLGFTQFKRCDESHPSKGDPGYWLMFITA